MTRHFFPISLLLCMASGVFAAKAVEKVSIQQDTPGYTINIKYPQNLAGAEANQAVKQFIDEQQAAFLKTAKGDDFPANIPGKNTLFIDYTIPYQHNKALSVVFDVSVFNRGAAHPLNVKAVFNFVDGHKVMLADLFIPASDYLSKLAYYCRTNLATKDFPDKKWVLMGTKPQKENYKLWSFSEDGLTIIFDTYQIAAYVYGAQTVNVPKSQFISLLQANIQPAVWG